MSSQISLSSPRLDDDDDAFRPDSTSTPRPSKRLRMTTAEEDEDNVKEPAGSVLPDSFLRSPRQTALAQHQPGSIVRVRLANFVTYEHAEFHPGPFLNMVIGPNGTGKSTLVCAICIGLGWPTKHLGRAKDVADFVKHGHNKGVIEIELRRDPQRQSRNPVITTTIKKQGNTTEFHIDGKKCSMREVQKLGRSFSIQVDNLCQFLPQDRVVEFATLTPVALLAQTQRAAAPEEVTQWHEELITLGKEAKTREDEQDAMQESLKRLEARQRAQQADVDRVREHASLQMRYSTLMRAKPFPLYKQKREDFLAAKEAERRSTRELTQTRTMLRPSMQAADDKARYMGDIINVTTSKRNTRLRLHNHASEINRKYEAKCRDITQKKDAFERSKEKIKTSNTSRQQIERDIQKLKDAMLNEPPAVDFAAMNARIRELTMQIRSAESSRNTLNDSVDEKKAQVQQRIGKIAQEQEKKQRLESQIGRQASQLAKHSSDTAKALNWLEHNRGLFAGEIFLPPVLTCKVTDQRCIGLLETAVGRNELIAFTTTSREDHDLFQDHIRRRLRLTDVYIRVYEPHTTRTTPLYSEGDLRQYGLEGYLVDVLEGPEIVIGMLCDNRSLDTTGYTTGVLNAEQSQLLKESQMTNWVSSRETSAVLKRREYGDKAVTVRIGRVRKAEFFINAPVDSAAIRESDRTVHDINDEIDTLKGVIKEQLEQIKEADTKISDLTDKQQAVQDEKAALQGQRTRFDALPTKIAGEEAKLAAAQAKVQAFHEDRVTHEQELDKLSLAKAQDAVDLASSMDQLRRLHEEELVYELMEIEAQSDLDRLKERNQEAEAKLKHHEQEVARLAAIKERLKTEGAALGVKCQEARDANEDADPESQDLFQEVIELSSDQLENEIQSASARLEANTGGNANIIADFEKRASDIERKNRQIEGSTAAREELRAKIVEIRSKWEPVLEDVVSQISASFAENFASIQCAGEVALYKDEDFEQWAIHIKVKFRESEPMSILDSHRQSGGERAVSTIFYLMALQSLARAPFRVVDEINQGMDPRNERLVHSRLVQLACQPARGNGAGGSQYFLITPKLLSGLEYHPNMKVHCIASGEHMPGIHSSMDFGQLAQKALAVRAL